MLELSPAGRVEHGFVKERLEQRSEIEAGPTDDEGETFLTACLVDPSVGILGPGCRRISLGRLDDVDPAVRNGRALSGVWLGRADIEATIDLPRVGNDDCRRHTLRQPKRKRALAGGRRPTDYRD